MSSMDKTQVAILRVLAAAGGPLGAGKVAKELRAHGIELEERAVRYHLEALDLRELTESLGRPGRRITEAGRAELERARVADKVNLVSAKLESFAYQTALDITNGRGRVPLNVSTIPEQRLSEALLVLQDVFGSRYVTSRRTVIYRPGDLVGTWVVPPDSVGIGTVCSVTINGVLLKAGIPIQSLFGGLLAIENDEPSRFTEVVHYGWTSLDPIEVFIKSRYTSVRAAAHTGNGVIGASFREFPAEARDHVLRVLERTVPWGISGVLEVGNASSPLYETNVNTSRCGLVIAAGLNPVAALEESGIPTMSHAMTTTTTYDELTDINELVDRYA